LHRKRLGDPSLLSVAGLYEKPTVLLTPTAELNANQVLQFTSESLALYETCLPDIQKRTGRPDNDCGSRLPKCVSIAMTIDRPVLVLKASIYEAKK
jgi:hypothetical protein